MLSIRSPLLVPLLALLTVASKAVAQDAPEQIVRAALERAAKAKEERRDEERAEALFEAYMGLDQVADAARAGALRADVDAARERLDPKLDDRLELTRRALTEVSTVIDELIDAKLPGTAMALLGSVTRIDPASADVLNKKLEAAKAARTEEEKKVDGGLALLFQLGSLMQRGDTRARMEAAFKRVPALKAWMEKRAQLAKEFQDLGFDYDRKKWRVTGSRLLRHATNLDSDVIDGAKARKVHAAASAQLDKERYERFAKPVMDGFRKANQKFGKSKKWKISGKEWTSPSRGREGIVVSKQRLSGPHTIEVDLQLKQLRSKFGLVFGWRDVADYYVVETIRQHNQMGMRVLHVAGDEIDVIAQGPGEGFGGAYGRFSIALDGRRVTVTNLGRQLTGELPSDPTSGEGCAYGFLMPALAAGDDRPQKVLKKDVVLIKNLIVTEK